MTHEESVKIIKTQFKKAGKGVLMNALSIWIPPLGVPPIRMITDKALDWIMGKLADSGEIGAFIIRIDFNVDSEGRAFMDAAIKNHEIQTSGSDEEKKIAEDNLKDAFRKLIRLSN